MYALADCNNFYCSCERLFDPSLRQKAMVVLSNNDGCAIARSDEAKQLGVVMGTPAFMLESLVKQKKLLLFSSNYTLYGDLSDRVMRTMAEFVPAMEIYSIDEAFLDMHDLHGEDLLKLGLAIRRKVKQDIGIPVSVGIAPTKTLAKMANRYAKKYHRDNGVFWAANKTLLDEMLSATAVRDVWGIGHQHGLLLKKNGIKTAYDFIGLPEDWVRAKLSVVGLRMYYELKGVPAIDWEAEPAGKKNICTSRSFGNLLTDFELIREAICNHAATCALKLRKQKSVCSVVQVFVQTNLHKIHHAQYSRSVSIDLPLACNDTSQIIKAAQKGLGLIFKDGFSYMKCGVIVSDIIPEGSLQQALFEKDERSVTKPVMDTMDAINKSLGHEIVRFAVQGYEKKYRLKSEFLSRRYTTRIDEIVRVNDGTLHRFVKEYDSRGKMIN